MEWIFAKASLGQVQNIVCTNVNFILKLSSKSLLDNHWHLQHQALFDWSRIADGTLAQNDQETPVIWNSSFEATFTINFKVQSLQLIGMHFDRVEDITFVE